MVTKTLRFPLTTDQLELLHAFESAGSLAKLAEMMGRDQSVISRQLQKLAECAEVIRKENGKWIITDTGKKVNLFSQSSCSDLTKLLDASKSASLNLEQTALIIINAQKAYTNSTAERSNLQAEKNIRNLLEYWRNLNSSIFHVKHISEKADSVFNKNSASSDFIPELGPLSGEIILDKKEASSF